MNKIQIPGSVCFPLLFLSFVFFILLFLRQGSIVWSRTTHVIQADFDFKRLFLPLPLPL